MRYFNTVYGFSFIINAFWQLQARNLH